MLQVRGCRNPFLLHDFFLNDSEHRVVNWVIYSVRVIVHAIDLIVTIVTSKAQASIGLASS